MKPALWYRTIMKYQLMRNILAQYFKATAEYRLKKAFQANAAMLALIRDLFCTSCIPQLLMELKFYLCVRVSAVVIFHIVVF
jgi:hypothetical protein